MCVRQMRPPGRGDFWILKIAHAPSDKNLFKNGFCPLKGGSLCGKDVFAKKFLVPGEIPLAARSPRFFGNTLLKAGHLMRSIPKLRGRFLYISGPGARVLSGG
jgi:hypothetical protein